MFNLFNGNCLDLMATMETNSIDAIVTDPPYGLSFMGKRWDYDVPSTEIWQECLRVLKPGGHLLAFGGSRTFHRMAVRIEDAGFELRDTIMWIYGSGFPKSLDVSKAIDKAAGAKRQAIGQRKKLQSYGEGVNSVYGDGPDKGGVQIITAPATEAAKQWHGWGTALKPAFEPIIMARKPLAGTVAQNVLEHGVGGINVDGCRVDGVVTTWPNFRGNDQSKRNAYGAYTGQDETGSPSEYGRFPANVIHDGSEEATQGMGDAARFFYCAKASNRDRDEGLEAFEVKRTGGMQATADGSMLTGSGNERNTARANTHPTVKPTDLMRYLCRLVTPPKGVIFDPFTGSGSTGKAAALEGFDFIGAEMEEQYHKIAEARIQAAIEPIGVKDAKQVNFLAVLELNKKMSGTPETAQAPPTVGGDPATPPVDATGSDTQQGAQ